MTDSGPQQLAARVRAIRGQLGLSQQDFAARVGGRLTLSTLRNVERAALKEGPRTPARRAIEEAAGWPEGEVDRILGAAPTPVETRPQVTSLDQLTGLLDQMRSQAEDLAALSAQKVADEMLAYYVLNCLSPVQRRVMLRGVNRWVSENPDYADAFA